MQSTLDDSRAYSTRTGPNAAWKTSSIVAAGVALALAAATFILLPGGYEDVLLGIAIAGFLFIALLHARFLYQARQQYRQTSESLEIKEQEYQSLFENALDAILVLDNIGNCRDANPSASRLLGVNREKLAGRPIAEFFPDRQKFESFWKQLQERQNDHGQSEMMRADHAPLHVEFTATAHFLPDRHMMVLRDITERIHAEQAKCESLALAKSASREADAMRSATQALAQDLRMNHVLDTLLETLHQLVPYEAAQVLLVETESKLYLGRELVPDGETVQYGSLPDDF